MILGVRYSLVILTGLLGMLPFATGAAASEATGTVTGKEAVFRFPASHDGPWRWHTPDIPDNHLEYGWEIRTPGSDGKKYAFGFMLFKIPGRAEGYGPLSMLLFEGQESLWAEDAEGKGSVIEGVALSTHAENGTVVIRLADPTYLRLLFGAKPSIVKAMTWANGKKNEFDVPIRYANARQLKYSTAEVQGFDLRVRVSRADGSAFDAPMLDGQDMSGKPAVSNDTRYVGWLALYPGQGASYSQPLSLEILDDGNHLHHFAGEFGMVSGWCYGENAGTVVYMYSFPHGATPIGFDMRQIGDGRLLQRFKLTPQETGGEEDQAVRLKLPQWARCAWDSAHTQ
jgi:hypothetical protein